MPAEDVGVLAAIAAREGGETVERGPQAEGRIGAPVNEADGELDAELDVAQATRTEQELAVRLGAGNAPPPGAASPGRRRRSCPGSRLPDHGASPSQIGLADDTVTRDHPALRSAWELPGLGPALVIGAMARDGAHRGACLPLSGPGQESTCQRVPAGVERLQAVMMRVAIVVATCIASARRSLGGSAAKMTSTSLMVKPAARLAHGDDRQPAGHGSGSGLPIGR